MSYLLSVDNTIMFLLQLGIIQFFKEGAEVNIRQRVDQRGQDKAIGGSRGGAAGGGGR